jgi:predicted TPR repeat methyltransferase
MSSVYKLLNKLSSEKLAAKCREDVEVRVTTMSQDLNNVREMYDTVAEDWAEAFSGEHEKKSMDQEILHRFGQKNGGRRPVWDFGCGPGNTTEYLRNLGIEASGLDLSEGILEQARMIHPDILDLEFEND